MNRHDLPQSRTGQVEYRSLSIEDRRTEMVYAVVQQLFADGQKSVRPGDVNSVLREQGTPLGTWEVRVEFTALERLNQLEYIPDSGDWRLTENVSLQDAC